MRLLVFSDTGHATGIVQYLTDEGHIVHTYNGTLVEGAAFPQSDIAIFDNAEQNSVAEKLRITGTKIVGTSPWASVLKSDQHYRDSFINALGYARPATKGGTQARVACWFNGQRFISRYLLINYQRVMSGDVGVAIESSGYIAYFNVEQSKLVNDLLTTLEKFLRKVDYRGCFITDFMCDSTGTYVVDVAPANDSSASTAIFENTRRSKSDIILDVTNGASSPIAYIDPYVCGVLVSVYPFPYEAPVLCSPLHGLNRENMKHFWLIDVSKVDGEWQGGQRSGCLGYVTARGCSVIESCRRTYRTIRNIDINQIQYRNDVGKDANDKLFKLRDLKLI